MKYVYFFGRGKADGDGEMKDLLGGKGAGLAEMTRIGLPVPAGFTISAECCDYYFKRGRKFPKGLAAEAQKSLARLERLAKKKLGDAKNPLLVSVRSGSARSMPGMMETILNLGLNEYAVKALARIHKDERFAWDAYRRFVQMYSTVVAGLPKSDLEDKLRAMKEWKGFKDDAGVDVESWTGLVAEYKNYFKVKTGMEFPEDPREQLWGAIRAVLESWMAERAVTYRHVEHITGVLGTAVNVVQMVFGNLGENSGTGVCFTRDPSTGERKFYGEFLANAQGEDVVAGIRTPMSLDELSKRMPAIYKQLNRACTLLEKHYRDMQDIEFTVEPGKLYILQTRAGQRTPSATFKMAVDMAKEGLISKAEAIERVKAEDIERLFYPVIDPSVQRAELSGRLITSGINAVPGAASGRVVFTAHEAEQMELEGEKVILVRHETSPEDVGGMFAAQGIVTATGGKTSHAAVVARGWGKCCVVGCEELQINYVAKLASANGRIVHQGDWITLDGNEGKVYEGQVKLAMQRQPESFNTLLKWADGFRTLGVRANADTPQDARRARELGAEGVGLCRTEHMFFKDFEQPEKSADRQLAIQEMILADSSETRRTALRKLLPYQRRDFVGLFKAMDGYPVTIRLIDPPLHEFVPHDRAKQVELAQKIGVPVEEVVRRVGQLMESNPMLGHRGCRLSITYPEILEMQVQAIMEAAIEAKRKGINVFPEIMHPLVEDRKELQILVDATKLVADAVMRESQVKLKYHIGTMVELPRAAILAGEIAELAQFFSFGTNDLTQTTMGLSRDDAGRFLPDYVDERKAAIFPADPFQTLDVPGVGQLIRWAIERGRATRPNLEVGICGEHGGDTASVKFCHEVGMDYVSASPYRVPVARLAAAQAAIEERKAGKRTERRGRQAGSRD